jgi:glycosyltransferase involved in cell wall biosynthesis
MGEVDELSDLIANGRSLAEQYPLVQDRARALARARAQAGVGSSDPFSALQPGLPIGGARRASRRPRVCVATSDLLGPVRNGGVGTACATLSEALAAAGHDVTILYVGPFEAGDAAHWRAHYRDRRIAFEVPQASDVPLVGTEHMCASYVAYEWLKGQPPFDVVHFPEINGVGFYALEAKRLGLALLDTFLCVHLHSPTLWHRLENRQNIDREEDLILDFIERESVARADALVSPTNYLLSWVTRWGFQLPAEVYVQPNVSHLKQPRGSKEWRRVS